MLDGTPLASSKPLSGLRLLIIEDSVECLNALKFLLEYNGAEVLAVATADEARAAFTELRPHVLISDLSLPGEDGFSFLASVRALPTELGATIPAVAFSAMAPDDAEARAAAAGFQAFLRKPGDVHLLVPTVVRLLPPALTP